MTVSIHLGGHPLGLGEFPLLWWAARWTMKQGILVLGSFLLAGCMEGTKPPPKSPATSAPAATAAQRSLYERMGGETAIVKVVDDFVANVVADPDIKDKHKKHFMEGDVAGLKKKLVDQVGQATGGPQKYTGKNMRDAHQGLAITDKDFDALVADLTKALDNSKVAKADQQELLNMLAPMRKDIVEKE
jgi:hemoglobin